VAEGETSFRSQGPLLSLLGTAPASTMRSWFTRLAGGASDDRLIDRYGVPWLIGFEDSEA
jgi:PhnB protein